MDDHGHYGEIISRTLTRSHIQTLIVFTEESNQIQVETDPRWVRLDFWSIANQLYANNNSFA